MKNPGPEGFNMAASQSGFLVCSCGVRFEIFGNERADALFIAKRLEKTTLP
jgi:hypothetical protein